MAYVLKVDEPVGESIVRVAREQVGKAIDEIHGAQPPAQAWPAVIKAQQRELGALGDLLGDEHDLAVLRQTVAGTPDEFGTATEVEALLGLIARRREELRRHARPLGERLFAEDAQALVRRFGGIWSAWERERTGELPRPLERLAAT